MSDPVIVGPMATGTAPAGTMPLIAFYFDMNGDGVPDWRQPGQIAKAVEAVLLAASALVPAAAPGLILGVTITKGIAAALPTTVGG